MFLLCHSEHVLACWQESWWTFSHHIVLLINPDIQAPPTPRQQEKAQRNPFWPKFEEEI